MGQRQRHDGAAAERTVDGDRAALGCDQRAGDRKAQSSALAGARCVAAVESLEDMRQGRGRDAGAGVADPHDD